MKTTEIISLSALAISFITFWLTYVRDNKKRFQEKIYDLKYDAYQEMLKAVWQYLGNVLSLMHFMQDFDGDKEEWLEYIQKESSTYYDEAFNLRDLLNGHVMLLPAQFINKYEEIITMALGHVTNHYHFETQIVVDSYDRLSDQYSELIDQIRIDLGVSKINKSLNKRLARDLYPIGFRKAPKE